MKKILSIAVLSALALGSCTKMPEYVEQEEFPELSKEQIDQNVQNVFGTTFDPNHDWSCTTTSTVSITANANLDNIVKVQILTDSPFLNDEAKVLNETAANKGDVVELTYDAPDTSEQLVAACVDNKGNYYIQVFDAGQKSVSFASLRSMTRASSSEIPNIASIKLKSPVLSFNARRTREGDVCKIKDDTNTAREYSEWKNSGWENDYLWELANGNTFDNGWLKGDNGDIYRTINGFDSDDEKKNVEFMINSYLQKSGGTIQTNGKRNNLPNIRSSANFTQNNNYIYTDGKNPVTLIPVHINTTEYSKNNIYYYYFKPDEIPADMSEVDYIKSLPKYKAINIWKATPSVGRVFRDKEFLLPFYKESPKEGSTEAQAIFPAGYKIGFLNRKYASDAIDNCQNGCTYGDGRLNYEVNHIRGHYNSAIDSNLEPLGRQVGKYSTKDGMTYTDPRIAIFTANKKTYLCFEDGADCTFCDMIIEIGSGTEQLDENIEVGNCTYTYCFEDRQDGDYDMNDVVIKAKRIDETHILFSLEACGAYDELYLRNIDGKVLNGNTEIHALFGVSTESFVNTEEGQRLSPIQETIVVNPNFSLANPDQQVYIYNKTTNKNIYLSKQGDADPHGLLIPYDYQYPLEKQSIHKAYKDFINWGKVSSKYKSWYTDPVTGEIYTLSVF